MSRIEEAEKLIAQMTEFEKIQLFQKVVHNLDNTFPGIDTNPDICGGEPCIVRTRIPVWILEQARQLGTSEADLLQAYPALRAGDLANAWAYVRTHQTDIESQIQAHEAA